jgi:cytochrome c-type biogenesis protein CcmH
MPETLEEAVAQLEKRLAAEPANAEGRLLLARAYMSLKKFDSARTAYAKAVASNPDDTDLQVEYAEALMRSTVDHRFPPQAVVMLERALAQNRQSQRALFFLGMHRMQSNQPAVAAALWQELLPQLTPEAAATLRPQVDNARELAGLPPLSAAIDAAKTLLTIELRIDPKLTGSARPGDTLYVFARGAEKGPPIAVKRLTLARLPITVDLSDSDSPMPSTKLSSHRSVRLMARLSKSGIATAASGDLETEPVDAEVGDDAPIVLVLSRVLP